MTRGPLANGTASVAVDRESPVKALDDDDDGDLVIDDNNNDDDNGGPKADICEKPQTNVDVDMGAAMSTTDTAVHKETVQSFMV